MTATMEGDDLDNLIADSIGGVQSALEGERKASSTAGGAAGGAPSEWAKEAVRELQQGPARPDNQADMFSNLVKTFQDESFQKAMADALQGAAVEGSPAKKSNDIVITEPAAEKAADKAAAPAPLIGPAPPPASGGGGSSSSAKPADETNSEEFLNNFLKSFDQAIGNDSNFEQRLSGLMTSMLSNDLICEPLQQISEKLEPWLKSQKGLSQSDRNRYEAQLKMYKQIQNVYKQSPDPLPDNAREEVQRLLTELHGLGQPPEEVLRQIAPKEAEEGGESFEDFMKSMGLDSNLGSAEQDLLKKLSEDPEELTKVMKDMAEGLPEEACKQQ
mmetsp:Transcript_107892/g.310887  ORF Transcript_107892/g.310887 Transcript_107892/m.310887 type:complete len:330 (+) Transcript_107892:71-1060(+)